MNLEEKAAVAAIQHFFCDIYVDEEALALFDVWSKDEAYDLSDYIVWQPFEDQAQDDLWNMVANLRDNLIRIFGKDN